MSRKEISIPEHVFSFTLAVSLLVLVVGIL